MTEYFTNLMLFNYDCWSFRRPSGARVVAFHEALKRAGVNGTVRSTRGDEHGAACGQLINSANAIKRIAK